MLEQLMLALGTLPNRRDIAKSVGVFVFRHPAKTDAIADKYVSLSDNLLQSDLLPVIAHPGEAILVGNGLLYLLAKEQIRARERLDFAVRDLSARIADAINAKSSEQHPAPHTTNTSPLNVAPSASSGESKANKLPTDGQKGATSARVKDLHDRWLRPF